MKNNNNLIAFIDLDGTLLREDKSISDYNQKVIADFSAAGNLVVLCSGRYSSFVMDKALKIAASDYLISDNGSLVYNYKTKEIIYENPLDPLTLKNLLRYASDNELGIILNCFEKRYRNVYSLHSEIQDIIDIDNFDEKVYQLIVSTADMDKANDIEDFLNHLDGFVINYKSVDLILNRFNKYGYGYDLNKEGNNKGNGIIKLLEYLNIDRNRSLAIGDHYNDASMFNVVAFKIAMDNAYSSLKENADIVTDNNENDGVGKVLERIMELGR